MLASTSGASTVAWPASLLRDFRFGTLRPLPAGPSPSIGGPLLLERVGADVSRETYFNSQGCRLSPTRVSFRGAGGRDHRRPEPQACLARPFPIRPFYAQGAWCDEPPPPLGARPSSTATQGSNRGSLSEVDGPGWRTPVGHPSPRVVVGRQ